MHERPYRSEDLKQVIETFNASVRSLAASSYTDTELAAWAPAAPDLVLWQQRLASLHTWIAEHEGFVAGFVSYGDNGDLDLLYTHPAFARQGVATRLYRLVESTLCTAGVPKVFTKASLAARPFFEHHGFALDAEEIVEVRGSQFRRFAMHKQLNRDSGEKLSRQCK